ncbi:MAG: outer membrane beta-barrel protein [Woeseiaceae bacterium]
MWRSLAVLGLFSISGGGLAEDFDYSFVQGSYGQVEFDDFDVDGDSFGIDGSFAVSDRFHVFGSYETADFDAGVDLNSMQAGLGFNSPLSDTIDFIASLAYVNTEVEAAGFGSADDNGYGLGLGLRAMASPALELDGGISYVDYGGDSDGDTEFGAGFLYHFSESVAVGLSGSWGDVVNSYALNGRFSFGD